jgi:hypothetical protein
VRRGCPLLLKTRMALIMVFVEVWEPLFGENGGETGRHVGLSTHLHDYSFWSPIYSLRMGDNKTNLRACLTCLLNFLIWRMWRNCLAKDLWTLKTASTNRLRTALAIWVNRELPDT